MRRWAIVPPTLVLVMLSAWGIARHQSALPSTRADVQRTAVRDVSWRSPVRAHPHGPEADELARKPAAPVWSVATGTSLWTGAGRHPMWRGCQHRYDPALSRFIFGSAATSR
jgi:hypothetical protein